MSYVSNDTIQPFNFPAIGRKKLTAAFDGGRLTSDGGVMPLAAAERRMGIAERQATPTADPRNPPLVTHSVADLLRTRMLAIACGYEDADDLVPRPRPQPPARRTMTRGAIAPNSPNPPNPNVDHAQAQIAMKQASRPYTAAIHAAATAPPR